eukprot:8776480-Alexandrium_andersonii.AAC.1
MGDGSKHFGRSGVIEALAAWRGPLFRQQGRSTGTQRARADRGRYGAQLEGAAAQPQPPFRVS